MDAVRYMAAAELAGSWLLRPRPRPQPVGAVTGQEKNAVYVVCDVTGAVVYVGSTCGRPAKARIAEHLLDPWRTRRWDTAWVIPLRGEIGVPQLVGRSRP